MAVLWGKTESQQEQVCERYQGNICLPYLMEWSRCILSETDELTVDITADAQSTLDQGLQQLYTLQGQFMIECMETYYT